MKPKDVGDDTAELSSLECTTKSTAGPSSLERSAIARNKRVYVDEHNE